MQENGNPPKNWLIESILVTIFCCLPLGIVGIINAANVNSRWSLGDYEGAERAAAEAKKWTKIGLITGLILMVGYVILMFTVGFGTLFLGLTNIDN
jgi:hypothetical protein